MKMVAPGLSIKVEGMKGPITEGEPPKCKEFGIKIATQLMPPNLICTTISFIRNGTTKPPPTLIRC